MTVRPSSRRSFLGAAAATIGAGLAGCGSALGNGSGTRTPPEYDQLRSTSLYLAPAVELELPERLADRAVSKAHNADLVVLSGETSVAASRAANWLADGRLVALLGPTAEATWMGWLESEAIADHFDTSAAADSEPDPDLLVGYARATTLSTSRYTWASQHNVRDVLVALEEAVADVRAETD